MKAEVQQQKVEPVFPAVTVTITLESAKEVQAFYDLVNLGNCLAVHQAMRTLEPRVDVETLRKVTGGVWQQLKEVVGLIGHDSWRIA